MWSIELRWLYDTFLRSMLHAEIGTYCGRSLLASSGGMSKSANIYCVDNDVDASRTSQDWVKAVREATIRLVPCNVTMLEKGSLAGALHCHELGLKFDSIFIDACHEYAEVCADINGWIPLLKPNGIIAGHDYWAANTGVMCAVNDVLQDRFKVVPETRIWYSVQS